KLKGINDAMGPATGTGTLKLTTRLTIDDRIGPDMTASDLTLSIPVSVVDGKANVKTSLNTALNMIGKHGLPSCSQVEVVSIDLLEEEDEPIGRGGLIA